MELAPIITESFTQYAGAVLQSRALIDVRDCIKPSAREIFYALYTDKFTYDKPYKKSLKAVGSLSRFYIHGDASAVGVLMRSGQPFAMRYPLVDVKGNVGTLLESGNWAHQRYTESRLAEITSYLFKDIEKDTIKDWRNNYDDSEQYPAVLPSKGFYNIVNGTLGIGIGLSSSIPQFNIKEVNNALIYLLWHPDCDYEEISCIPDFATGAVLLNRDEVKESLKNGKGKSCRLRSVIEYDEKERALIVKEIPFGVYTNTICGELEKLLEEDPTCGITRFNDLTGEKVLIKIYLTKKANPERVLKLLYKNTSLQSYYSINMTMLDNGRFPKVFTWKEALQAHLDHEISVYKNGFLFDLKKIKHRLFIIEGLLKAIDRIDEVIKTIKSAEDTKKANIALQKLLEIEEEQAKAILDIKLARLAHLEIAKLENEKLKLLDKKEEIENILNDDILLKKEVEKGLIFISNKFGDARRTQVLNLKTTDDEDEAPIEEKELVVHLSNLGNIYTEEKSTLLIQKRGGKGTKIKLLKNEYLIDTFSDTNASSCLAFSNLGKVYSFNLSTLTPTQKINVENLFELSEKEKITRIIPYNKISSYNYIVFTTSNGLIKKTKLEEYRIKKSKGVIALKIKENDSLIGIDFVNDENIQFLTKLGKTLIIDTKEINDTGRNSSGVCGIKLNTSDEVICTHIIPKDTEYIIFVSNNGLIKKMNYKDFSISNRATKGVSIQKLKENDIMSSFIPVSKDEKSITLVSNKGFITFSINDISETNKNTQGVQSKNLTNNEYIIKIIK